MLLSTLKPPSALLFDGGLAKQPCMCKLATASLLADDDLAGCCPAESSGSVAVIEAVTGVASGTVEGTCGVAPHPGGRHTSWAVGSAGLTNGVSSSVEQCVRCPDQAFAAVHCMLHLVMGLLQQAGRAAPFVRERCTRTAASSFASQICILQTLQSLCRCDIMRPEVRLAREMERELKEPLPSYPYPLSPLWILETFRPCCRHDMTPPAVRLASEKSLHTSRQMLCFPCAPS
jgi:hypothetical protein